jgi:hypothetical protein
MLSQLMTLKARGRDKRGVSGRGLGRAARQRKAATRQRERHRVARRSRDTRGPDCDGECEVDDERVRVRPV